jgi:hypothetical protein
LVDGLPRRLGLVIPPASGESFWSWIDRRVSDVVGRRVIDPAGMWNGVTGLADPVCS